MVHSVITTCVHGNTNLHISRERLGVRRWNFHQTVAHGVVYLMRVSLCTELCGLQQQHAEMRRYETRIKPENVILKQQGCQQRSRGMFINFCHQCTRGRVGNNEGQLPVSPQGLFGWHGLLHYKPATI